MNTLSTIGRTRIAMSSHVILFKAKASPTIITKNLNKIRKRLQTVSHYWCTISLNCLVQFSLRHPTNRAIVYRYLDLLVDHWMFRLILDRIPNINFNTSSKCLFFFLA